MTEITELRNRVIIEYGDLGGTTKYWVKRVRQEGEKVLFTIPYAETLSNGKWVHDEGASIMLTARFAHMYKNSMADHPEVPSPVEYVISATYGTDLHVCKEGFCISDVPI